MIAAYLPLIVNLMDEILGMQTQIQNLLLVARLKYNYKRALYLWGLFVVFFVSLHIIII